MPEIYKAYLYLPSGTTRETLVSGRTRAEARRQAQTSADAVGATGFALEG